MRNRFPYCCNNSKGISQGEIRLWFSVGRCVGWVLPLKGDFRVNLDENWFAARDLSAVQKNAKVGDG